MSYQSPYAEFIFESYSFDQTTGRVEFTYSFDGTRQFVEELLLAPSTQYEPETLDRALQCAFVLAGISYYKAFPTKKMNIKNLQMDASQAEFFSTVYYNGLSQFVYENGLNPEDIAVFEPNVGEQANTPSYERDGTLVLQSGGKDSLLLASLLQMKHVDFSAWYLSQSHSSPQVLDKLNVPLAHSTRKIDREGLSKASQDGALNGHVPVTFIVLSYALIDAILKNNNTILAAIGHEGEEPHAFIGDYAVRHQWSKTWPAEQLFQAYVTQHVGAIRVGSPLRGYSELKIAKLFVEYCWQKFGHDFSSCNVANYRQGHDNSQLTWCGECPKCANSFLLFAAFVDEPELTELFGENLFKKPAQLENFKGLLGIDGVTKPFECVGEIDELRAAYHLALERGYGALPFDVPTSDFVIDTEYPAQAWAQQMIQ